MCVRKGVFEVVPVCRGIVGDWGRGDGYRTGGYFKDEGDVVGPAEGTMGDVVVEGEGLAVGEDEIGSARPLIGKTGGEVGTEKAKAF